MITINPEIDGGKNLVVKKKEKKSILLGIYSAMHVHILDFEFF